MTEGSDLSHWNPYDPTGCDFVFLKVGQGAGFIDPAFGARIIDLRLQPAVAGGYWFLDGTTTGGDQAKTFLDKMEPKTGELLALDWEWFIPEADLGKAVEFAETVRDEWGGPFALYTVDTFSDPRGGAVLADLCDLWYVEWGGHGLCKGWTKWKFKQTGTWKGGVDHDVFNGSVDDLADYAGGDMALEGTEQDALAWLWGYQRRTLDPAGTRPTVYAPKPDALDNAQAGWDHADAVLAHHASEGGSDEHVHVTGPPEP